MLIDFSSIEEGKISNFHGGDKDVFFRAYDEKNKRIMLTRMIPGSSNGLHKHETNSEIIYVISGEGEVYTDGVKEILKPGVATYCPLGSSHEIKNTGKEDLVCFNVIC